MKHQFCSSSWHVSEDVSIQQCMWVFLGARTGQSQCRFVKGVDTSCGGLEVTVLSLSPQQSFLSGLFSREDAVTSVILLPHWDTSSGGRGVSSAAQLVSQSLATGSPRNHVQGDCHVTNLSPVVAWRPRAKASQRKNSLKASPVLGITTGLFAKLHTLLPS